METQQYKVRLENYYGPLDLLLHLIRENEIDIYNIPIAAVAQQYIGFLELMKKLDINLAGEFLVMASSLLEIKSRLLLPKPEELGEEEELDPRMELVKKLLQYRQFKELARRLAVLMELQGRRHTRPETKLPGRPRPVDEPATAPDQVSGPGGEGETVGAPAEPGDLPELEIGAWDVYRAYETVTRATSLAATTSILYDDLPLEEIVETLLRRLRETGRMMLSQAVGDMRDRGRVVGHFLAALELSKQKHITVSQEADFSDIELRLSPQAESLGPDSQGDAGVSA